MVEGKELQEILVKCWMTHDGAWYASCAQEFGFETANRLNKTAISLLAPIELRRVTKALGIKGDGLETFEELRALIDGMFSVVKGEFMDFTYVFTQEDVLQWQMNTCFAYEGMKRIGADEHYECGVLYRVQCWIEAAGAEYMVEPPLKGCLMRETGECSGSEKYASGRGYCGSSSPW